MIFSEVKWDRMIFIRKGKGGMCIYKLVNYLKVIRKGY